MKANKSSLSAKAKLQAIFTVAQNKQNRNLQASTCRKDSLIELSPNKATRL